MPRFTKLSLGASAAMLLIFGLAIWTPSRASAAPGEQGCSNFHTIAKGEYLSTIAADYEVSLAALIDENGITDPNIIVIGQELCIPNGGAVRGRQAAPEQYSYPSAEPQRGGHGSEESYGVQEDGSSSRPWVKPGQSYDPSYFEHGPSDGQWEKESYGPSDEQWEKESYGPENYAKAESHSSGCSLKTYQGVPGKAYDPSVACPQAQRTYHIPEDDEIDPDDFEEPIEEPEEPEEPVEEEPNGENGNDG